jgi:thiol:disulfide interchange protein DsbA
MSLRHSLSVFALLVLSTAARAGIVAGHDYQVLATPQRTEAGAKIEVIEFFSWGCPHCYEFYPLLERWRATLPKDVAVRRIPVGFGRPQWDTLVTMFYALEITGDLARLDSAIFEAIHREHESLVDEPSVTAWVARHGVNVANFKAAFHAFGVQASVSQARATAEDYGVDAVPTLAIGGRYTVSDQFSRMLATTDQLIAMVRSGGKVAAE